MKVLFVVLHTGYVRNYNGALRQLAARGHPIHIAYEVDRDRQGERLWVQRLAEDCSGVTWGPTPEIDKTVWTSWASLGRALLDYLRYLDPRYAKAVKLRRRVEAWVPQGFPKIVRWTGGATENRPAAVDGNIEGDRARHSGQQSGRGICTQSSA